MPRFHLRIDPVECAALRAVDAAARTTGADWFVAGATARDWLLQDIHGIKTLRATRDIDFGIAIREWESFNLLKEAIVAEGQFLSVSDTPHRLNHARVRGFHIDLVPFGPLQDAQGQLVWPGGTPILDVTGFEEAHDSAIEMVVEDGLVVRVASLPGQMLMKLFAWRDRQDRTMHKDAWDLRLLLTEYERAGNTERIYDEGLMDLEHFDARLAAARLLGRDVAVLLRSRSRALLLELIDAQLNDPENSALIKQMAYVNPRGQIGEVTIDEGQRAEETMKLLASFRAGLDDRKEGQTRTA